MQVLARTITARFIDGETYPTQDQVGSQMLKELDSMYDKAFERSRKQDPVFASSAIRLLY